MHSFPVDYINFGGTNGIFLGLEKTDKGEILHYEDSERFGRGTMAVFSMTDTGNRRKQEDAIPGMSATHQEAWYVDTVKAGKPTWSSIYAWEDQPDTFSISYNAPIVNGNQQLLSVVGVDMIINQLSTWLQDAWENDQGLALIVEANGDLVASSSPELTLVENGKKIRRANISELDHHLANHLHTQYFQSQSKTEESPSGSTLPPSTQPGLFKVENEHYLTQATPWGENYGLDWYLITAVRADQEWGAAQRNQILFLCISITAILIALLINRRQIRGLLTPLTALTSASLNTKHQIKEGEVDSDSSSPLAYNCNLGPSSTREVLDLSQAIQFMVEAFNRLTQTIRKKDEQALAAMSSKLKVSLEAASIAHEIKQPLSIVRLTSQSLHHALDRTVDQAIPKAISDGLLTLNQETERISTITEKIRALLRNAQTKTEPVDLIQVIESSVRYIESNHSNKHWIDRRPLQQISDEQAIIQGDAIQLQLALINLFKNAVEALTSEQQITGQGEKSPAIRVSLHRNGQQ